MRLGGREYSAIERTGLFCAGLTLIIQGLTRTDFFAEPGRSYRVTGPAGTEVVDGQALLDGVALDLPAGAGADLVIEGPL